MYQMIQEKKKQYKDYKDRYTIEQLLELISIVGDYCKSVNIQKQLYNYCKTEHKTLISFIKTLNRRCRKKDLDNQIVVEGGTGSGKSTLSLILVTCQSMHDNTKFDLSKDIIYKPSENELSSKLITLKAFEKIIVDETIKSLNKLKWHNKDVIDSNEIIQTERFRNNTIYYCIPNFHELTKSFRSTNIKIRIWLIPQYRAIIRIKNIDVDLGWEDPWHTNENIKIKKSKNIGVHSTEFERIVVERELPNYHADFDWPDIEKIPKLMPYHFLYELHKHLSRKQDILNKIKEGTKEKLSKYEAKRKAGIIGIMKICQSKQNMKFKDFNKLYGTEIPLSETALYDYWEEATNLLQSITNNQEDTKNIIIN